MSTIHGLQLRCDSNTAIHVTAGQITAGGATLVLGADAQANLPAQVTPQTAMAVWLVQHNGNTQPKISDNFDAWTGPGEGACIGTAWVGSNGQFMPFQQSGGGEHRTYHLGGSDTDRTWVSDGQSHSPRLQNRHWTLAPSINRLKMTLSCGGNNGSASVRNPSHPQETDAQNSGGSKPVFFTVDASGGTLEWWTTADGSLGTVIIVLEELI